ncbi:MAG: hypothetical protein LYZ70_00925 [Nitrososphaerales archaeon]|nr:hypothetical protein [Nitrososphaerales archaeon]
MPRFSLKGKMLFKERCFNIIIDYDSVTESALSSEAKVRRIGTGYGIPIPKKRLDEMGAGEGDAIILRRVERPAQEIRDILAGTGFKFERDRKEHEVGTSER